MAITPVMVPPAVIPKEVTPAAREIVVGSVKWREIPVSPVTPFNVIVWVLPAGGIIVQDTGVEPPVGQVIVLKIAVNVLISICPGLAALEAAETVSVAVTPPVNTIVVVRVAVVAIG